MKVTVLGCGTSGGVPTIGNDWGSCDPDNPRNRRSRVSILIESSAGTRILVDTSPDLRTQLLANAIDRIDAVIWTHDHADHCHGIDDLRGLYHRRKMPIPAFGRDYTLTNLSSRFGYAFTGGGGYSAMLTPHLLSDSCTIEDVQVGAVDQPHGPVLSTGLRFNFNNKSIVYATDFNLITDKMVALYSDCDVLIVDCLREPPHPTHAHLGLALELAERCSARQVVLTHMDKSLDYETLRQATEDHVYPAFDGMTLSL